MDNSYILKHPKDKRLYRFLAYFMTWTSVGCQSWWGYPTPNKFIKIIANLFKLSTVPVLVSQTLYVYQHFNETPFNTLGTILCLTSMLFAIILKVFSTYFSSTKKVMENFMEKYHVYNSHDGIEFNKTILKKVEFFSNITAIVMYTMCLVTCIFWLIVTLVYNISNREEITLNKTLQFQNTFYVQVPIDYLHDFSAMIIYFFFNVIITLSFGSFISTFDVINYIIIYHLIGHIVILKNEIKTKFTRNSSASEAKAGIVEIIQHHNFIIRAFKDVQSTYGLGVLGSHINNLLTNSFLLYLIMLSDPATAVRYAFVMAVYFGGFVVMSLIFEQIRIQCYNLSEILYELPWESMSISNQKCILIMLAQMQPPLIFVATGGLVAGIQPLIFIVKTTFSYYVMLKSMM